MEGIFTKEQEVKLAQILDDVVKVGGIVEIIDGYVFKAIIGFVDDEFVDRLPEDLKLELSELAQAVLDEDVDQAEMLAGQLINRLIDVPLIDESTEGVIFNGIITFIVGAVQKWVEKRNQGETADAPK